MQATERITIAGTFAQPNQACFEMPAEKGTASMESGGRVGTREAELSAHLVVGAQTPYSQVLASKPKLSSVL